MLVGSLVGCATTETQPSASVTSLAPNAQQWFSVSWTADPERNGERRLHGHIDSSLGEAANRVQLLAQALDASGNFVASWPVPGWDKDAFREPYLALLPDGHIVATDPTKDRLYYFDPSGRVTTDHKFDKDTAPVGITMGAKGELFVTDKNVRVTMDLPFMLRVMKGTIEDKIKQKMDELL